MTNHFLMTADGFADSGGKNDDLWWQLSFRRLVKAEMQLYRTDFEVFRSRLLRMLKLCQYAHLAALSMGMIGICFLSIRQWVIDWQMESGTRGGAVAIFKHHIYLTFNRYWRHAGHLMPLSGYAVLLLLTPSFFPVLFPGVNKISDPSLSLKFLPVLTF